MSEHFAVLTKGVLAPGVTLSFHSTPLPLPGRIRRIIANIEAANANGPTTFDVNLNGASIFSSPSGRPSIPAGETTVELKGLSIPHLQNAKLSADADAVPVGGVTGVSVVVVTDDMLGDKPVPVEFFIRAMYLGALDREPDEETELQPALEELTAAGYSFGFIDAARALATDIFTSDEFTDLTLTNAEYVTRLYKAYLNRDPTDPETLDTTGLNGWVAALDGGETRSNVRNAFAVATEFINRAPRFFLSQVPVADATSIEGKAPAEFVRDAMAAAFTDSSDLDFSADDAGDTATAVLKTTGVGAGTYGSASAVPRIVVDAKGRITGVTEQSLAIPDAEAVRDAIGAMLTDTSEFDFTYDDGADQETLALKTTGVGAGTYGDAGNVARVTVDAKGRVTAASQVAITSGAGSSGIVIGPDTPPANPSAYDDEFNSTALDARWTVVTNTANAVDVHTTWLSAVRVRTTGSGQSYTARQNFSPGGNFSLTACLLGIPNNNFQNISVGVMDGDAQTNMLEFVWQHNNGPKIAVHRSVAGAFTFYNPSLNGPSFTSPPTSLYADKIYYHIQRVGNDFSFYYSFSGRIWQLLGTITFAFTVNRLKIACSGGDSAGTREMGFDWIRVNWRTV